MIESDFLNYSEIIGDASKDISEYISKFMADMLDISNGLIDKPYDKQKLQEAYYNLNRIQFDLDAYIENIADIKRGLEFYFSNNE